MKIHAVDTWQWFGKPGHFICGQWCRFHLATKVGPWLVSTVGELVHPLHSVGSENSEMEWLEKNWPGEDIGAGRKYETMVFLAGEPCTAPGCNCGLPSTEEGVDLARGYDTAGDATAGHMSLCAVYAGKRCS